MKQWERVYKNLKKDGWTVRHVEAMHDAETIWTAIATRGDVRHSTHANDITLAFQELEECCRKDPLLTRRADTEFSISVSHGRHGSL